MEDITMGLIFLPFSPLVSSLTPCRLALCVWRACKICAFRKRTVGRRGQRQLRPGLRLTTGMSARFRAPLPEMLRDDKLLMCQV